MSREDWALFTRLKRQLRATRERVKKLEEMEMVVKAKVDAEMGCEDQAGAD